MVKYKIIKSKCISNVELINTHRYNTAPGLKKSY